MSGTKKLPAVGAELICVSIGEHLYAIDIMQVREIRGWTVSTPSITRRTDLGLPRAVYAPVTAPIEAGGEAQNP